eukprot:TRINITY_DN5928_c0_g1_i4.p1 TRINITY_DN5928_c0_g1~~TRINITY_DN5928_c0_g1_i4.p1  ORF type:complete len:1471 (-),score=440.91 TRINITY_DN5928_c0_g1_i4:14-3781(-)
MAHAMLANMTPPQHTSSSSTSSSSSSQSSQLIALPPIPDTQSPDEPKVVKKRKKYRKRGMLGSGFNNTDDEQADPPTEEKRKYKKKQKDEEEGEHTQRKKNKNKEKKSDKQDKTKEKKDKTPKEKKEKKSGEKDKAEKRPYKSRTKVDSPDPSDTETSDDDHKDDQDDASSGRRRTVKRPRSYSSDEDEIFVKEVAQSLLRKEKAAKRKQKTRDDSPEPDDAPSKGKRRPLKLTIPGPSTKGSKGEGEGAGEYTAGSINKPRKCWVAGCGEGHSFLRLLLPYQVPSCPPHAKRVEDSLGKALRAGMVQANEAEGAKDQLCGLCMGLSKAPVAIRCHNESCAFVFCQKCLDYVTRRRGIVRKDRWSCWVCEGVWKGKSRERAIFVAEVLARPIATGAPGDEQGESRSQHSSTHSSAPPSDGSSGSSSSAEAIEYVAETLINSLSFLHQNRNIDLHRATQLQSLSTMVKMLITQPPILSAFPLDYHKVWEGLKDISTQLRDIALSATATTPDAAPIVQRDAASQRRYHAVQMTCQKVGDQLRRIVEFCEMKAAACNQELGQVLTQRETIFTSGTEGRKTIETQIRRLEAEENALKDAEATAFQEYAQAYDKLVRCDTSRRNASKQLEDLRSNLDLRLIGGFGSVGAGLASELWSGGVESSLVLTQARLAGQGKAMSAVLSVLETLYWSLDPEAKRDLPAPMAPPPAMPPSPPSTHMTMKIHPSDKAPSGFTVGVSSTPVMPSESFLNNRSGTLIVYHRLCLQHLVPPDHLEQPERLRIIIDLVQTLYYKFPHNIDIHSNPEEVDMRYVMAVHDPKYIAQLKKKLPPSYYTLDPHDMACRAAAPRPLSPSPEHAHKPEHRDDATASGQANSGDAEASAKSPDGPGEGTPRQERQPTPAREVMLSPKPRRPDVETHKLHAFHSTHLEHMDQDLLDTFISQHSLRAAMRASGAVCEAIDAVLLPQTSVVRGRTLLGGYTNAFCAVRPPGHHAGRYGRTDDAPSQGFCLINNVVIGARYALINYPDIQRIAVVDFDVHHGNGTQELLEGDENCMFYSIHVLDERDWFYPGTGDVIDEDEPLSTPSTPPHRTDEASAGADKVHTAPADASSASTPFSVGATSGSNIVNVPLRRGASAHSFMKLFYQKVIRDLDRYQPQLIIVSAGFDAHKEDPTGGMRLAEDDYFSATKLLKSVAAKHCGGKIVSVLEGGYGIEEGNTALRRCVEAHIRALANDADDYKAVHGDEDLWVGVAGKRMRKQVNL